MSETHARKCQGLHGHIEKLKTERTLLQNKVSDLEADKQRLTEQLTAPRAKADDHGAEDADSQRLQIILSLMDTAFTRLEALRYVKTRDDGAQLTPDICI